jgi:hypothetical protein
MLLVVMLCLTHKVSDTLVLGISHERRFESPIIDSAKPSRRDRPGKVFRSKSISARTNLSRLSKTTSDVAEMTGGASFGKKNQKIHQITQYFGRRAPPLPPLRENTDYLDQAITVKCSGEHQDTSRSFRLSKSFGHFQYRRHQRELANA